MQPEWLSHILTGRSLKQRPVNVIIQDNNYPVIYLQETEPDGRMYDP